MSDTLSVRIVTWGERVITKDEQGQIAQCPSCCSKVEHWQNKRLMLLAGQDPLFLLTAIVSAWMSDHSNIGLIAFDPYNPINNNISREHVSHIQSVTVCMIVYERKWIHQMSLRAMSHPQPEYQIIKSLCSLMIRVWLPAHIVLWKFFPQGIYYTKCFLLFKSWHWGVRNYLGPRWLSIFQ